MYDPYRTGDVVKLPTRVELLDGAALAFSTLTAEQKAATLTGRHES